jgi:1-acyl-sn-glycerol-3-phosphate acyltransferase
MALERNVPLVPVVAIGGQETALFLSRGERLARALRLKQLARLDVLPISIALPWGLNIGDLGGHIPLPAKITVQVLEPIDLAERYGDDPDHQQIYEDVTGAMQRTLDDLADERRLPVIG